MLLVVRDYTTNGLCQKSRKPINPEVSQSIQTPIILARYLGFWRSMVLFVVIKLGLLFTVRDNLTLNVLMLVHPIESIKAWQMVH